MKKLCCDDATSLNTTTCETPASLPPSSSSSLGRSRARSLTQSRVQGTVNVASLACSAADYSVVNELQGEAIVNWDCFVD